ncbi:hypothetical protein C0Q70_21246 [Pomacea canaliculata]|uniref:Uncharacterized protein n=1 Tax=Pomacea canaliculata TaxID=400727 RepID=A0A2T7NBZ0_POMCA|nr:hypothetical protein C0Q70_21246 [Pomacea canaliculata]
MREEVSNDVGVVARVPALHEMRQLLATDDQWSGTRGPPVDARSSASSSTDEDDEVRAETTVTLLSRDNVWKSLRDISPLGVPLSPPHLFICKGLKPPSSTSRDSNGCNLDPVRVTWDGERDVSQTRGSLIYPHVTAPVASHHPLISGLAVSSSSEIKEIFQEKESCARQTPRQ